MVPSLPAWTAPAELSLFDSHRKQALTGARDRVAALPFRSRAEVLSLRSQVQKGSLPVAILTDPDVARAYAAYIVHQPPSRAETPGSILFAVPTEWGTPAVTGGGARRRHGVVARFDRSHPRTLLRFREDAHGWRINRTPALDRSASENELGREDGTTGNRFIYQLLGAQDADTQDRLWQPLEQ